MDVATYVDESEVIDGVASVVEVHDSVDEEVQVSEEEVHESVPDVEASV